MNILDKLSYALKKIKSSDRGSRIRFRKGAWILVPAFSIAMFMPVATPVQAATIPNTGFEDGTFTGWNKGTQSGTLGSTITGNGSGVTIFTGSRTFTHGSRGAVGSPSSPYYAPAVASGSWTFSPNNGTNAVLLQPKGEQTFDQSASALGLSAGSVTEIKNMLTSQAQASGNGGGTPTDAAWITREVQLTAGTTYTMAWNYVGTDYVPYNDGSITSLVPVTVTGTPVVTVNNYVKQYALLGFTNPGTGDYSTNSFSSTGWQTSTYEVSITGTYKLGFASFNLDDQGLPPGLMVDSEAGSTNRCISGTCASFGGVPSNSETAPTVPPTTTTTTTIAQTTTTSSTTTTTTTTTTTLPPASSLVVTSLDDTTSSGTLRWAITQANANAGGIYDAITFNIDGTITLTSALPQVTQNLTVTGNGRTQTIIDGNNLYRPFNIASTKSLTISNMTLKQGQATNGGLVNNGAGTFSSTNVRFTGMTAGSAVFNNGGGSVSTLTNTTFDYLYIGIAGDYGSTPSALSQTDSDYTNRTYVYDSVFSNNTYGISGERFFKINNTQFISNTQVGAELGGLNRQQVTNSTFTSNGTGVYFSSWIPTGWAVGAGNQTVSGNTFNGNTTAIQFANNWNTGSSVYNGVSANSFSTASGNTFGNTSANTNNFSGSGYAESGNTITTTTTTTSSTTTTSTTSTTTTTTVPTTTTTTVYVPPVVVVIPPVDTGTTSTSVSPVVVTPPDDTTVPLPQLPEPETESTTVTLPVGTEPETALPGIVIPPVGTEPETVVVIIPPGEVTLPEAGEAISTGDLAGILDNAFTPDASSEEVTAVLDGLLDADLTPKQFDAVVDAALGSLEEPGADVGAVIDSFLEADLTDKEFTKVLDAVFSEDVSSEVFTEALTTMLGADLSDKELDKVLDAAFSETTSPEAMVSALSSIFDGPASGADISKVMGAVFDEDISIEDTKTVLGDLLETTLSKSEAEAVFDNVFDNDLSDAETIDLIVDVLKNGLTAENLGAALGAVFDESVSTEVLIETFTAVLGNELNAESVGVIVDVLESDTITNDQVSQVVDLITGQEGGIDPGQSAALSASPKVLESITPDQATEVFAALDVTNVTPEQEAELAAALTNAPNDIKEALEEEVDIYGDGFDDYVALGSEVNVGARRTLIAATTAVAAITAATGAAGGSGGSSGGGNSNGPSGTNNNVAKKNEEEEMAGEIAGPGDDEDSNFTKNSIFKYYIKEGIEMREFNWLGFGKKLWDITAGLAFTFAGSVVVYYTLSGTTQTIALASTITACVVHYAHQLLKNDED